MGPRTEIIQKTLTHLDELSATEVQYSAPDFPIDKYVDEAVKRVVLSAPIHALGGGNEWPSSAQLTVRQDGVGIIDIPEDFLRMIWMRLPSWRRGVAWPIYENSPEYARQMHRATRGGSTKPVCAIVEGGKKMELYIAEESDTQGWSGAYFPATPISDETLFPHKLLEVVAWTCASLVLTSIADYNAATAANNKAAELLQSL